jgi:ribonuclease P protein component
MVIDHSFGKDERLSSEKEINELFLHGKKYNAFPLRIFWNTREREEENEVKILISVPKKLFARAVDRNLIKRRIREGYRKNKQILLTNRKTEKRHFTEIAFIYNGKEIIGYNELETKIISVLQSIAERL